MHPIPRLGYRSPREYITLIPTPSRVRSDGVNSTETVGAFFQDLRARGLGSVTALNGEYDAWAGRMKPSNEGRLRPDLAHEALGAGHADTRSGARPRDRTRAARKAPCDRSIGRTAGDLVLQLSDVQDLDGL